MGMEPPSWMGPVFGVVTGDGFPAPNETKMRSAGVVMHDAGQLLNSMTMNLARSSEPVLNSFSGGGATAFATSMQSMSSDHSGFLSGVTQSAFGLRDFLYESALQVEHTKYATIGDLTETLYDIFWLIAMAPFSGGLTLNSVSVFQLAGRELADALVKILVRNILTQ